MKPREETLHKPKHFIVAAALLVGVAVPAGAQQPSPPPTIPYGPPIGLEAAKKVMAAAEAEAVKNNWPMAVVILDSTGHIVMLHRLDNTQYGSIGVAEDKAHTALDSAGAAPSGDRKADKGKKGHQGQQGQPARQLVWRPRGFFFCDGNRGSASIR